MSWNGPSDSLRDIYEHRGAIEYAAPGALPHPRLSRKFERMVALVAETLPAESLLDAGCGDGRFLAGIARLPNRPGRLVGADISQRILETAGQWSQRDGFELELVRANIEALPIPDASFDRVLCVQAIEHLLDPQAGLAEMARVLRPGGKLVLSTDSARNLVSRAINAPRTMAVRLVGLRGRRLKVHFPHRAFHPDEIVRMVEETGLAVEHRETFAFHVDGLSIPAVTRLAAAVDRAFSPHSVGDIVAVVASKNP